MRNWDVKNEGVPERVFDKPPHVKVLMPQNVRGKLRTKFEILPADIANLNFVNIFGKDYPVYCVGGEYYIKVGKRKVTNGLWLDENLQVWLDDSETAKRIEEMNTPIAKLPDDFNEIIRTKIGKAVILKEPYEITGEKIDHTSWPEETTKLTTEQINTIVTKFKSFLEKEFGA